MPFARWQATITDGAGNVIPSPHIEVKREIPGAPLAVLYADRDGAMPLGNPFQVETGDGFAAFHVAGGAYKVRAYAAGFEREWRFVAVGTNSERDFGTVFLPRGAWSAVTTYATGEMVSHEGGGEPYAFVSNQDANTNHAPQFDTSGVGLSDTYWTVVGLIEAPGAPGDPGAPGSSNVVGTSASNVAIGTGAKTFAIVEASRGWGAGARLRISSDASPAVDWMEGIVTSYTASTLELAVDLVSGAGSHSDWTINLAGHPGSEGPSTRVVTAAGAVTVAVTDEIILLNKTVGAATNVSFPAAAAYVGRGISIKDIKGDAGSNNITPVFDGAETCDGLAGSDYAITVNYGEAGVFRPLPGGAGWYLHKR